MKAVYIFIAISLLVGSSQLFARDYQDIEALGLKLPDLHEALHDSTDAEDFEARVNALAKGNRLVSVFVEDTDTKRPRITVYLDSDPLDGKPQKREKIFAVRRLNIDYEGRMVNYASLGYGPYHYYTVPPTWFLITNPVRQAWLMQRKLEPYHTPLGKKLSVIRNGTKVEKSSSYSKPEKINLRLNIFDVEAALLEVSNIKDFENEVNKIYSGPGIIAVKVKNSGTTNQSITLFIDSKTANQQLDGGEAILTLTRSSFDFSRSQAMLKLTGYGAYAAYSHIAVWYPVGYPGYEKWILDSSLCQAEEYITPQSRLDEILKLRTTYRQSKAYQTRLIRNSEFSEDFNRNYIKAN